MPVMPNSHNKSQKFLPHQRDAGVFCAFALETNYNIDEYKDIFISYIHNHFEKNAGNIFLLKVKFRNDNTIL